MGDKCAASTTRAARVASRGNATKRLISIAPIQLMIDATLQLSIASAVKTGLRAAARRRGLSRR